MPFIAVKLAQNTFAEIMSLVNQGIYSSPEQFLEISAFNQLALERGAAMQDLARHSDVPAIAAAESRSSRSPQNVGVRKEDRQTTHAVPRVSVGKQRRSVIAGEEAIRDSLTRFSVTAGDESRLGPCSAMRTDETQRIWGQVNRIFPLKLAARWIAGAAQRNSEWPLLSTITDQLVADAAVIGSALEQADLQQGRKREEALAIGLPRTGNLQSRDRYLSQFVARVTRSGDIFPGAITQYGLACFDADRVVLSSKGLSLANLRNPVFDGSPLTCESTFSAEEKQFLLAHIADHVPSEKRDFGVILAAITSGHTTPESLLLGVRRHFPSEWSELTFRTHVYGVLGRLGELGLIGKQWEGRRVQYMVLGPTAFAA